VLDIHLFVEALAFCSLHIDGSNSFLILPDTQVGFEKILLLIERMSVSEGLKRMKDKRNEDKIKSMGAIEKIDLMAPFRRKYVGYFELREREAALSRSLKIRHQAFKSLIMMDPNAAAAKYTSGTSQGFVTFGSSAKKTVRHSQVLGTPLSGGAPSLTSRGTGVKADLFSMILDQKQH
jgi:hypothetical protein